MIQFPLFNQDRKTIRAELHDSGGNPLSRVNINKFGASIEIIPSTLTIETCYFMIYNPVASGRKMAIDNISLASSFIGTAASTRSTFKFQKFTTPPPTGGSAVTPLKFDSTKPDSIASILASQSGLTMTGVVLLPYFHEVCIISQVNSGVVPSMQFTGKDDEELILQPGEGIVISAESGIVAGGALIGSIHWHEY